MKSFRQYINEEVSQADLNSLEKVLDALFAKVNIDIGFTKHFLDRVNDKRNKTPITVDELTTLFKKTFKKYGNKLKMTRDDNEDMEAILLDIQTDINIPFILSWNPKDKELELITKTVMRKKKFKASDPFLKV